MSGIKGPASDFSSSVLEEILGRFEQAWQVGKRPDIADHLPEGEAERKPVLVGLVAVDLKRRLTAGDGARIEDYLERMALSTGSHSITLFQS